MAGEMAGEVFEGVLIDYYGSPEVMADNGKHEGLQPCLRRLHGKRVRIRVEELFEVVCYEADEEVCCADATPEEKPAPKRNRQKATKE